MTGSHDQTVSSSAFSDLVPGIGDAVAQGIARIVSIKNEAGTLTPARFEEFERSTLDACLELGRCVVRGSAGRSGCAAFRRDRTGRRGSAPTPGEQEDDHDAPGTGQFRAFPLSHPRGVVRPMCRSTSVWD